MNTEASKAKHKSAVYVGAGVTAVVALLPRISDFFVVAFVLGAFAAVWFAIRRAKELLSVSDAAQLGFLSGFYGLLAASAIYDVVWKFFHYELWQIKNADRLLSIFAGMVHDAFSPSAWLLLTVQIIICAILAGSVGAPSGILAVKLFQRRNPM
ncbi:MAG: hypothetical protein ABI925_07620 [Verrucomicrobiota bacterium]